MPTTTSKELKEQKPIARIAPEDLNNLMSTLEVNFVGLSECLVSQGCRLELGGAPAAGIHYNLDGVGRAFVGDQPPFELKPHTLIIVPPQCPFKIEVSHPLGLRKKINAVTGESCLQKVGELNRFVAGDDEPEIKLICGFFQASYGGTVDLFAALHGPIIEQFGASDQLDSKLKSAMAELISQEAGSGAMSSALLKQVIVAILRRSLHSINLWVERFAILSDPRIARTFSEMASNPGKPHTVESLAELAFLSRSAFMSRFQKVIGQSPMIVLRELRMRQAARELKASNHQVDKIARNAGYASRSSFVRAFKESYGIDPTEYRTKHHSISFSE